VQKVNRRVYLCAGKAQPKKRLQLRKRSHPLHLKMNTPDAQGIEAEGQYVKLCLFIMHELKLVTVGRRRINKVFVTLVLCEACQAMVII